MIKIREEKGFTNWFSSLTKKEQTKVASRLEKIKNEGHFGDVSTLGDGISELCWKNGWRVYFIVSTTNTIVLILGGKKNDQKKDIKQTKIFVSRYTKV
jgi:putative addiction module killer protein